MISLTVDGISVEIEDGGSILDATMAAGVYVPTLCYQEDLDRFGACRLCLVEVEGFRKLVAACTTPATDGMVIKSKTPEIDSMRKTIVELLLLHHPLDCLVCDKGGDCDLQELAFNLKVTEDRFGYKETPLKYDKADSIIMRDMSKCVLCGRCVRVCDEIRNIGAIGFFKRGVGTEIGYPFNRLVHCEVCGQCLESCPVGALNCKTSMLEARPWEIAKTKSICSYCGCGCSLTLECKGSKVVKVSSDNSNKDNANKGLLCAKGRFGYGYVNSPDRIKTPMIRKGGELVSVSWEEAVGFAAENLSRIKDESGPDAIGGLGSGKCTNEDNYIFQKFFRDVIGTNNLDNYFRSEHASTFSAMQETLGLPGIATNTMDAIADTPTILLVGANPSNTHPFVSLWMKRYARDDGAKIIVIDPQEMELSRFTEKQLKARPGADIALLNCITFLIMKKNSKLPSFEGAKELAKHTSAYTPQKVSELCGLSVSDIEETADILAKSEKVSVIFGEGFSTDKVKALINLSLVLNVFEDGGFYPLRSSNNVQGCCDMGVLPDYFPGYEKIEKGGALPDKKGLNFYEMLGNLKALYVMGENPTVVFPGTTEIRESLKNLDFLIVQDIFLSEAAEMADVVFPAASYAEKEGTFTNLERRVQRLTPAMEPLNDSLGDWEIIQRIANKMGANYTYKKSEEVFKEISSVVYKEMTYEALGNHGLFWPDKVVKPSKKKASLVEDEPAEKTSAAFPFLMLVGTLLFHHQSGAMSSRADGLNTLSPEPICEMNVSDAEKAGIKDGAMVEIRSKKGSLKLKCKTSKMMEVGMVFLPANFKEASVGSLFDIEVDSVSGSSCFKALPVSITAVGE